jgi:hypothetical protein
VFFGFVQEDHRIFGSNYLFSLFFFCWFTIFGGLLHYCPQDVMVASAHFVGSGICGCKNQHLSCRFGIHS